MLYAQRGYIDVETREDSEKAYNLKCKCGHAANMHGFFIYRYGTMLPATVHVSQCCLCGDAGTVVIDGELKFVCERFECHDLNIGQLNYNVSLHV